MPQPTLNVLDSVGATKTINTINPNGRAAAVDSNPIVLSTEDLAVLNSLATSAKQDTGNSSLSSIDGKLPALVTTTPDFNDPGVAVRQASNTLMVYGFDRVNGSTLDADGLSLLKKDTGMAISQASGSLAVISSTTANEEVLIRSTASYKGAWNLRFRQTLSQRIVNNGFFIYMADLIGESLAFTVNSATSITVTIPGTTWTSANVGQSVNFGVSNLAGTIPGRYAIASVSGTAITFTVAGFPGSGSGTCTLWGWNYIKVGANNATATNISFDAQRNGWNSGDTQISVNTTASGHYVMIQTDGTTCFVNDSTVGTQTGPCTARGSREDFLPVCDVPLYLFIWSANGTTNPASTTTWTLQSVTIENYPANKTVLNTSARTPNFYSVVSATNLSCNINQIGGATPVTFRPNGAAAAAQSMGVILLGGMQNTDYNAQAWAAASGSGATIAPAGGPGASTSFDINVSVWTVGTSTGLVVVLQESLDNGTTWIDRWFTEAITAAGHYYIPAINMTGRRRMRWFHVSGSATTATVTVTANDASVSHNRVVQYFDRTSGVGSGTASSGTNSASYDISGIKALSVIMNAGTATAVASFKPQMSIDGSNWYDAGAATAISSTSANMTALPLTSGVYGRFLRVTCTATGTSQTINNIQIHGTN